MECHYLLHVAILFILKLGQLLNLFCRYICRGLYRRTLELLEFTTPHSFYIANEKFTVVPELIVSSKTSIIVICSMEWMFSPVLSAPCLGISLTDSYDKLGKYF